MKNTILQGDCLEALRALPKARVIFADPPDNLGLHYEGYADNLEKQEYITWLVKVVKAALTKCDIFWLSYNPVWDMHLKCLLFPEILGWEERTILWRYTFGQYNDRDLGRGYRPILRISKSHIVWNNGDDVRVESERQRLGDSRCANHNGRMPDDVWDFSRVVGNARERRAWHPTQHPEALILRILVLSLVNKDDSVYDLFAGTGTVNRVCKFLVESGMFPELECVGIERSKVYCDKIREELGLL